MNVLILGGSGLIGKAFSRHLVADGHRMTVLSRNPAAAQLPPGVKARAWDGRTPQGWQDLVDEADALVNLAGENIGAKPWTKERKARILQSRLDAGSAVNAAIRAAGQRPRVLIQASAVGIYGPRGLEPVDETSAPGDDFMADVVKQWEASTQQVEGSGVRRVVIRTGLVLDRSEGILPRFLLPFQLYAGGPMGTGKQGISWIHLEDQVRAMAFLMTQIEAQGIYNLCAPQPLSNADFGKNLARVMRRPFWLPTPGFGLRLLLGEMADLVLLGQFVRPTRLTDMGYDFAYPHLEPALKNLLG
jgi:uncharacterized protein